MSLARGPLGSEKGREQAPSNSPTTSAPPTAASPRMPSRYALLSIARWSVGDEDGVAGITGGVVHGHVAESRFREHPQGGLLAPRGAQPGAADGEGGGE